MNLKIIMMMMLLMIIMMMMLLMDMKERAISLQHISFHHSNQSFNSYCRQLHTHINKQTNKTHLLVGRLPDGSLTAIFTVPESPHCSIENISIIFRANARIPGPAGGAAAANSATAAATSASCFAFFAAAACCCKASSCITRAAS
jgi:hypothetical protein